MMDIKKNTCCCFTENSPYRCILLLLLFTLGILTLSGCQQRQLKTVDLSIPFYQKTHFGHLLQAISKHQSDQTGGFRLIHNGMEAHAIIQYMISKAEKSLDLQYWSFHQDNTGKVVMRQLLKAADRGVKIRLLLDDFIAQGGNANLSTLNNHPNIKVRLYNPISESRWLRVLAALVKFKQANRRMHNKVLLADNAIAIVGGRNIGDAYYYVKKSYFYKDLDVLTIGPPVKKLSTSFDLYWNAKWSTPLHRTTKLLLLSIEYRSTRKSLDKHYQDFVKTLYWRQLGLIKPENWFKPAAKQFIWAPYQVLYDPPNKVIGIKKSNKNFLEYKMTKQMIKAKQNVKIITPYFVPQRFGLRWIKKLHKKKVPLYLLTNSFAANDSSISHGGYQRYRSKLLKFGVNLYEFKAESLNSNKKAMIWFQKKPASRLHAKSIIIDNKYVYIGSVNLTPRSRYLNTELCVKIESKEFALQVSQLFDYLARDTNSYKVILAQKKYAEFKPDDTGIDDMESEIHWLGELRGKKTKSESDPNVTILKHLIISFLSLLPIEDLL